MFAGNCYTVMAAQRDWNDANRLCQADGGELVSIKSVKEWEFVKGWWKCISFLYYCCLRSKSRQNLVEVKITPYPLWLYRILSLSS